MAIDQTDIAVQSCRAKVAAANDFLSALDRLETIKEQIAANGIVFANYEAIINSTAGIKHCTPST